MAVKKFGVGQALRRVEDQRLLTGGGLFMADFNFDRQLHGFVLRSPHAHAQFSFGDLAAVRAMKGVRLVLTAADVAHLGPVPCLAPLPNDDGSQNLVAMAPVLAEGVARHVGDAVAFIVADSLEQARDASEAVPVTYVPKKPVIDMRQALAKGEAAVWDKQPDNLAYDASMGDKAKVDAVFAKAAHVVSLEIENNRLITNYMETRGAIGDYDAATQSYTLHLSSQGVHGIRDSVANLVLKIAPEKLRVITGDVGGGFGTKTFVYREYPLVLEAAKILKRPVKWIAERSDHFVGDCHGRDNLSVAEVAMDSRGKFLAMRFDILGNLGAYLSQYGPYIPYLGGTMMTGVYKTPLIHVRVRGVYTNTVPVDAYRGAGRPEAAYMLERLVDRAARKLKLSQAEIRRRNFISPAAMPYKTPIGQRSYDTGEFDGHMTRALEAAHWDGFAQRLKESRKQGLLRGIGLASYIECTAWGEGEDVKVTLEKDGSVTIYSGTQSNGQGHATAYAQFAAQHLDVPLERIKVVQGDTAKVRTGNGTGGSRSIPVGGISVFRASEHLAGKLKDIAAGALEAAVTDLEIADGHVVVAGTDRRISFVDIAKRDGVTETMRSGQGDFVPPDATYPNGSHVAEVVIDPDTGRVTIARYTICDDFGLAVNPMLLAGQVHGGVAQGIGQALLERTVYDAEGQLITASLMDYALPRANDMPSFDFETRNVPSTTNPMGIKGAGEAGSIGSCPAVMNAVVDALHRAYGITHIDMPATPQAVWAAIQSAKVQAAE